MVLAARDSGEAPQANWGDPAAYKDDPQAGAGPVVHDLYWQLVASTPLRVGLTSTEYRAAPVSDLWPPVPENPYMSTLRLPTPSG